LEDNDPNLAYGPEHPLTIHYPSSVIEPPPSLIICLVKAADPSVGFTLIVRTGVSMLNTELAAEISVVMLSLAVTWEISSFKSILHKICLDVNGLSGTGEGELE